MSEPVHRRSFALWLSNELRDRAWFAAEDARAGAEAAALAQALEELPQPPDRQVVELRLRQLRSLRDAAGLMTPAQRGELVAVLGRVVVEGGVRLALDPGVARLLLP